MKHKLIPALSFAAIVLMFASAPLDLVFAQNETVSNTTSAANITNATGGNMTGGNAKTELQEGIKALQGGDVTTAKNHLTAAQEAMTGAPPDAIRHFEEGMKAFASGDNNAAIMHLNIANEALG
jgi:hypothetical protein